MFGSKEFTGLAIQDDVIRVARLYVDGNDIVLTKLDRLSLVEEVDAETQTRDMDSADSEFESDEDADSIFGLDEDDEEQEEEEALDLSGLDDEDELGLDMVDESETPQSNEMLIYDILTDAQAEKIHLGLNIPAGHTIFQVIRETDFNEVKTSDLVEDLEDKLQSIYGEHKTSDNYSYEIREDGSLLLGSIEDESVTLQIVNRARELYSGKLAIESVISDEISLVGLVRANYELDPDEMTGIIHFGKDNCRVVFMKGEEVWQVSPIINEGTSKKSFMNTIFSKILFQLDTGEVPNLDRIVLANNTVGDSAVEFFRESFPDIAVENLNFDDEFIQTENVEESAIPGFTTAIGVALAASGIREEAFPEISFIPKYVADRQKIFKLQWHGMLILFLIFLTPITFNYFYNQNARQIDNYSSELDQMNSQLKEVTPIVQKSNELSSDLSTLKEKLTMLDTLAQGSKEWSTKMRMLNQGIQSVGSSWITNFTQSQEGVFMQGITLYRNRVPQIVALFEDATLQSVNNETMREQEVYNFSILVKEFAASDSVYSPPTPEEVQNLIGE